MTEDKNEENIPSSDHLAPESAHAASGKSPSASVDRELLSPPAIDPYASVSEERRMESKSGQADRRRSDAGQSDSGEIAGEDSSPGEIEIDEDAPSVTASAATVTSAGGSTMARRVRKARRVRRGRKAVARRRSVVGAVVHTLGALAALSLIGATTWALGWAQLPEFQGVAEPIEIAPAPGDQQRVCPGSLQQLGLSEQADLAAPVGTPEITVASTYGDVETVDMGEGATEPVTVEAPGEVDGAPTVLSALQSVSLSTSDSTGLSVTNCTQPMATQWVVGGATTIGHTLVLDVINPGQSDARVNFAVYGIDGAVVPGLAEVVIEPGQRNLISLAGMAPNAGAFAVKVSSTGSAVSAFLHETITDTLTPKGSDVVGATALPSTVQTLPGIFVYGRPDADVTTFAELGTTLRILNPGDTAAAATLTAYDVDGEVAYSGELELASMRVVELPFAEVPEGEYSVVLESDQPLLLAGRVSPLNADEFAWIPSSSTLVGTELVPVAPGPNPRLSIFNATDEAREIVIDGAEVTLEPRATYQKSVSADSTVEVTGAGGLTAALHYADAGQLASAPVYPGNADAEPIRVVK